jgi:hypothetical protein
MEYHAKVSACALLPYPLRGPGPSGSWGSTY